MTKYGENILKLLAIQIGCVLRLARLNKRLSQHELSLLLGTNSTMIGRIERAEHMAGWDKILLISQQLDIEYCSLFVLMNKNDLLSVVDKSLNKEEKLTTEKTAYYHTLKRIIENHYNSIK